MSIKLLKYSAVSVIAFQVSALISIVTLFIFLAAGFAFARIPAVRENRAITRLSGIILYLLLFFMGYRIASGTGIDQLPLIGSLSLVFALSVSAGTALVLAAVYAAVSLLKKDGPSVKVKNDEGSTGSAAGFAEPLKLLAAVCAGFLIGWFADIQGFTAEKVSGWMLRFLLFSIGIDMVKNRVSLKSALARPETIYLPVGAAAGSLLGSLVPAVVFGLEPGKAAAVASGFGWYSLSGVLIADMGDPVLGSAAFLSNIIRETIALLTIPLIARSRFPHIGIGVAGATSMDVTLPLIEKSCGADAVPLSISSGALLSLAVPVLVPLFYQL